MSQTRRGPDPQVSPATERDDNFPERIAEAVVRAGGVARLARLYRMLEPHLRSALPDADDATMEIVDSLLAEAGTDPLPGVREGLHRAMVEHGLTRDGAREFLRCLQRGLDAR